MAKKKLVILISGKKGSGKSYMANEIKAKEIMGKSLTSKKIISFAAPLKINVNDYIEKQFGKEYVTDASKKEIIRPFYQAAGTVARSININYWIDLAKETIKKSTEDIFIIDDVRFENELNAFNDYDVIKIKSTRVSSISGTDNDSSETGLDHVPNSEYDLLIDNIDNKNQLAKILYLIYNQQVKD